MSFFAELQRRNVVRVGLAYAVIGWVLAQIAEFAFENFGAPQWALKTFVVVLLLGLPLALFFAWAFELTPDGIKRENEVDRGQSVTPQTGRKLDFIIIGVLAVGIILLLTDRFVVRDYPDSLTAENQDIHTGGTESADARIVAVARSIAVLPFVNMSDDKDYFADGLSEELLNLLAKIPDLKVAGRTSSFAFKGKNDDLREIGDALGVATVLEGSVRRSGDRLRITAQLIQVEDGFHVWSETYDRQMADIFDIQDDVASAITGALRLQLAPGSSRPTENTAAYALYIEALPYIAANDDRDIIEKVIGLLDGAIALDPGFAKAHEAKALTYWITSGDVVESAIARPLIVQSARTALQHDPSLLVAGLLHGNARAELRSWVEELRASRAAFDVAPNDFNIARIFCYDLLNVGYLQEALRCADNMVEIEPLSSLSYYRQGAAYGALGRSAEAWASWRRAGELGNSLHLWDIAINQVVEGEYEAAISTLEQMQVVVYGWSAEDARLIIANATDPQSGKAFLDAWVSEALAGATNFFEINKVYSWYLALGHVDDYWLAIDEVGSEYNPLWSDAEYLIQDGIANPASGFSKNPRYIEYAKAQGLTDLWDVRGEPDMCSKESGEWVCE